MTFFTFLVMAPFLKALLGWNVITTNFFKNKLNWFFSKKESDEIELAQKCAKEALEEQKEDCQNLDDKAVRLRNFFSEQNQIN